MNAPVHHVEPRAARRSGQSASAAIEEAPGEQFTSFSSSDTLATLCFRALAAGEHEIRLAQGGVRVYDRAGQSVNVDQAVSGKVRVSAR